MLQKDNKEFFTLSEIAEIFSRNKNTIQKYKKDKKISGFKQGNTFYYSFADAKKLFGNYSETTYRILRGDAKTATQREKEKEDDASSDFSNIGSIRSKADADFALQLERIRELRRENDLKEKKLVLADRVRVEAEKLFSALFDEQREFIDKLGIELAWSQAFVARVQGDFNSTLKRAKEKAMKDLQQ